MIDINTLDVGDTIYHVTYKINFPRKKYTVMVDDIEYYRYDGTYSYEIEKMIVSGYVDMIVNGVVDQYDVTPRKYYFYNENGTLLEDYYCSDDNTFTEKSFLTMNEAEDYIKEIKENQ